MRSRQTMLLAGLAGAVIVAAGGFWFLSSTGNASGMRPDDREFVTLGGEIYADQCASCHGRDGKGEPNWREPLATGGMPAPPHDESGHTWHHPGQLLFDYTKRGGQALIGDRGKSNMPPFGDVLSDDEIWAVLSYIKSTWPAEIRAMHDQRNGS